MPPRCQCTIQSMRLHNGGGYGSWRLCRCLFWMDCRSSSPALGISAAQQTATSDHASHSVRTTLLCVIESPSGGESMGEFFKPWRRSFGVVTLGLACLLLAGWVRSLSRRDWIEIGSDPCVDLLVSNRGNLMWECHNGYRLMKRPWLALSRLFVLRTSISAQRLRRFILDEFVESDSGFPPSWKNDFCGFKYDEYTTSSPDGSGIREVRVRVFPYWSIVAPLTLLSACLLLSKPGKTKPAQTSDQGGCGRPSFQSLTVGLMKTG